MIVMRVGMGQDGELSTSADAYRQSLLACGQSGASSDNLFLFHQRRVVAAAASRGAAHTVRRAMQRRAATAPSGVESGDGSSAAVVGMGANFRSRSGPSSEWTSPAASPSNAF